MIILRLTDLLIWKGSNDLECLKLVGDFRSLTLTKLFVVKDFNIYWTLVSFA